MQEQDSRAQRLLIVSNRLPFTVVKHDGDFLLEPSSGGLVSGLTAYLDGLKDPANSRASEQIAKDYVWLGWPGASVAPEDEQTITEQAETVNAYPVFIPEEEMESFYHGFCNSTIWPLFHYFPSVTYYNEEYWATYKQVNERFADAVLECLNPGDTVWVHDYQLMLLPDLIRKRMPDVKIGFFLHIPFPGFELFRLLPRKWGREILLGLLGADLVGFHTHNYTQYFLRSVLRVLGYDHNMGQINYDDRIIKADTFPMGIDFNKFHEATITPEALAEVTELRRALPDTKIVLSIDRLDYTKGIPQRLHGYEAFLEQNPQWRGKVVLTLVVIPSRVGVGQYRETKETIDELVGRINGRFGTLDWVPIRYQYTSLPFEQLVALYQASDAALVTPLRDGMNLIAKEYIAASTDTGVLILSEMAGAAQELGEAIIVNPNSRTEISEAIVQALEMPADEQRHRNKTMQNRLRRYDVVSWTEDFIRELDRAYINRTRLKARLINSEVEAQIISDYIASERRLILLDYDGTLMPFSKDPRQVSPNDTVLTTLRCLGEDPANEVVVISGRDRQTLDAWLGHLHIGLIAEHGVWVRPYGEDWNLIQPISNSWKPSIRPILEMYADRLPGAFVEEKDYSLVWHYRAADPELGILRSQELLDYLVNFTANIDVQVLQGNKVIEIKTGGINKGTSSLYWWDRINPDFALAIGDDWTDEYLFMALPKQAYTIRVGLTQSNARHNLRDHTAVLKLLADLYRSSRGGDDNSVSDLRDLAPALN
ncbi:MAG: bifunctional alpha,alpha-trehalose-phosphate synthase (UDP-forming)/trehalose-phosphatase [Chloroflexota bacterium]